MKATDTNIFKSFSNNFNKFNLKLIFLAISLRNTYSIDYRNMLYYLYPSYNFKVYIQTI